MNASSAPWSSPPSLQRSIAWQTFDFCCFSSTQVEELRSFYTKKLKDSASRIDEAERRGDRCEEELLLLRKNGRPDLGKKTVRTFRFSIPIPSVNPACTRLAVTTDRRLKCTAGAPVRGAARRKSDLRDTGKPRFSFCVEGSDLRPQPPQTHPIANGYSRVRVRVRVTLTLP